jgi:hypothetical protein
MDCPICKLLHPLRTWQELAMHLLHHTHKKPTGEYRRKTNKFVQGRLYRTDTMKSVRCWCGEWFELYPRNQDLKTRGCAGPFAKHLEESSMVQCILLATLDLKE